MDLDDLISALEGPRAAPGVDDEARAGAASRPATVAELQDRLRQIPAELAALRAGVQAGKVAVSSAEVVRRLLEGEARALTGAITASGTATVEEVEQLRALVLDVTRGCEGCRARVTAALRGGSR